MSTADYILMNRFVSECDLPIAQAIDIAGQARHRSELLAQMRETLRRYPTRPETSTHIVGYLDYLVANKAQIARHFKAEIRLLAMNIVGYKNAHGQRVSALERQGPLRLSDDIADLDRLHRHQVTQALSGACEEGLRTMVALQIEYRGVNKASMRNLYTAETFSHALIQSMTQGDPSQLRSLDQVYVLLPFYVRLQSQALEQLCSTFDQLIAREYGPPSRTHESDVNFPPTVPMNLIH